MKTKSRFKIADIFSLFVLLAVVIFFAIYIGPSFYSLRNVIAILEQFFPFMLGGLGMIFIVAFGGADLSIGSLLGVTAMISALTSRQFGTWALFPTAILIGVVWGLLCGVIVSYFKVPSYMTTLAMLIIGRAVVQIALGEKGIIATTEVMDLDTIGFKLPLVIVLAVICYYLFEYTRFGYYCKGMGENESMIESSGVNVKKWKILGFVVSAVLASIAGVFTIMHVGGGSSALGNMYEMRVMMCLYIGGIPVTGGMATRMYKLLIGAPLITILENGLTHINVNYGIYQAIEGIVLLLVVITSIFFNHQAIARDERISAALAKAQEEEETTK